MPVELRRPETILLPLDFSEASTAAARCAELIAKRFHSKIVLLHVLEPVEHPFEHFAGGFDQRPRPESARDALAEIASREFSTVKPAIRVTEGEPAQQIAAVADDVGADLLVMPTRGKGAFRRFLLGSVTAKILNDVPVPVLTTAHSSDTGQSCRPNLTNVLCAVALDGRSEAVCRAAAMIAAEYDASLSIVHVPEIANASSSERLRALAAESQAHSANLVVQEGHPYTVIASAARSTGADLVIIGRSSPGPLGRLRGQSYSVIRESPVPVLSV